MNMMNNLKTKQIVARQLILRRSGTYQSQYHRGYESNPQVWEINRFNEMIVSNGLTKVTPALIAKAGGDFLNISPHINSNNPIEIPNQWNNCRGIFILELEIIYTTGGSHRYFIQGFTDHDGFTNQSVDPRMRMYINTVITAQAVNIQTPHGVTSGLRMINNYHLASDFSAPNGFAPNQAVMSRPQDIFGCMMNSELSATNVMVTDMTSKAPVASSLVSSRRQNNIPTSFLSSVFNSYNDGMLNSSNADLTVGGAAETAFGYSLENEAATDEFLRRIRENNNLTRGRNFFTYSELMNVAPNVDAVKQLVVSSGGVGRLSQAGDSNHFQGQTLSTQAAVQLAVSLPSLMLECMLGSFHITVSNQMGHGLTMAPAHDHAITCFSPDHTIQQYQIFQNRALMEIFNPITKYNQLPFHAEIRCAYHSEFVISIKIGNDPETYFVTPTFADSLTSPVIATTPNQLGLLSESLGIVCDRVGEAITASMQRKDAIISSNMVSQPSTGAMQRDAGMGFALPPVVNQPSFSMNAPFTAPKVSTGPSANSM